MSVPGITSVGDSTNLRVGRYIKPVVMRPEKATFVRVDDRAVVVAHAARRPRAVIARTAPVDVAAMKKQLQSPNPTKRLAAVKALGRSKNKDAVLPLIKHLTDPHYGVNSATWKALATLYAIPAIKRHVDSGKAFLRVGLNHNNPEIRKAYAFALGLFKDKGSVPVLRTMVKSDKSLYAAGAAAWALAKIGARDSATIVTLGSRMYTVLSRVYTKGAHGIDYSSFLRHLGRALNELGYASIVRIFLNKLLDDLTGVHLLTRRRAVWGLYVLLRSKSLKAAYGASKVRVVGRRLLQRLKHETDYGIRSAIVWSLQMIRYRPAVQALSRIFTLGVRNLAV